MKKIYIAAYHQSKFGKLMGMTVPEILRAAVEGACREIHAEPAALDVASVGAACNQSLNEQGLLAGLAAEVGGLEGKMIESVENACASGGQAVLSVAWKLQLGFGETGIAIGYEKMRGPDGKADGKLVGKALGYYSHPDERPGKTFVFPHMFAEIMQQYMAEYGVTEEDLARIAVEEYACAQHNPYAQMRGVALTLEQALRIEGVNRYVVEGLPLKTYDCSQITDGYAALILATEEGLARLGVRRQDCVELAGYGQATDRLGRAGRVGGIVRRAGRAGHDAEPEDPAADRVDQRGGELEPARAARGRAEGRANGEERKARVGEPAERAELAEERVADRAELGAAEARHGERAQVHLERRAARERPLELGREDPAHLRAALGEPVGELGVELGRRRPAPGLAGEDPARLDRQHHDGRAGEVRRARGRPVRRGRRPAAGARRRPGQRGERGEPRGEGSGPSQARSR